MDYYEGRKDQCFSVSDFALFICCQMRCPHCLVGVTVAFILVGHNLQVTEETTY